MLREVEFTGCYDRSAVTSGGPQSGLFHKWGEIVIYKNEDYYTVTVGIVESGNGKIFEVPPHLIQFMDRS